MCPLPSTQPVSMMIYNQFWCRTVGHREGPGQCLRECGGDTKPTSRHQQTPPLGKNVVVRAVWWHSAGITRYHTITPHHSSGLLWGVCLPVIWRCWLTWELNFRGRNWLPAQSQQSQQLSYLTFLPTVCLVARSVGQVWWSVSVSVRAGNLIHVTGLQSLSLNATVFFISIISGFNLSIDTLIYLIDTAPTSVLRMQNLILDLKKKYFNYKTAGQAR